MLVVTKPKGLTAKHASVNHRRQHRYGCTNCRDLGRVKKRGEIGVTELCPKCNGRPIDPAKVELILGRLMVKKNPVTR